MFMRNHIHSTRFACLLLGASTLGLLCGCERSNSEAASTPSAPVPNVQTILPHRGEISRAITLPTFRLLAYQEATLYAKVAGYLKTLNVDIGDTVTQGQCLAEIDVPEMLAERPKYQAEAEAAKLDYQRARAARQKAPDLVVPQTVDDAKAGFDSAEANLQQLNTMLGYATITAPFSGVVTRRWVDPGAFIPAATASSAARDAAILTLMDARTVRVQVAVPGSESPFIKPGRPARMTVDALPGRVFEGTITRYAPALDEATKTLLTEMDLANPDGALLPGMFASVRLVLERRPDALLVPAQALVMENNQTSIFIVADGRAKKVAVKTGFNDGLSAEIISGLQPGEPVVVAGQQLLADGQPVNAVEVR